MSYHPGPDDIKCLNPPCGAWYHKALPYCPMCDAPNLPAKPPAPLVPVPVQSILLLEPAPAPYTDRHTRTTVIVVAVCAVVVLLVWGGVQLAIMRQEVQNFGQVMSELNNTIDRHAPPRH